MVRQLIRSQVVYILSEATSAGRFLLLGETEISIARALFMQMKFTNCVIMALMEPEPDYGSS